MVTRHSGVSTILSHETVLGLGFLKCRAIYVLEFTPTRRRRNDHLHMSTHMFPQLHVMWLRFTG